MSDSNTLTVAPGRRQLIPVSNAVALFDTAQYDHMNRIAIGMSAASLIPEHLRQDGPEAAKANCLMVVNQAMRWDVDPFALAGESYVVKGKLAFQGKVMKAVIAHKLGIDLRFLYNSGIGDQFAVVCFACDEGVDAEKAKPLLKVLAEKNDRSAMADLDEMGVRAVRLSVEQGKTDNKIWQKDPEQKLVYSASIRWARRYVPQILLGVLTDDDIDGMRERSASEMPRAQITGPEQNGPIARSEVATVTDDKPEVLNPPTKPAESAPKPQRQRKPATETAPAGANSTVTQMPLSDEDRARVEQLQRDRVEHANKAAEAAATAAKPPETAAATVEKSAPAAPEKSDPPKSTAPAATETTAEPEQTARLPKLPTAGDSDNPFGDADDGEMVKYPPDVQNLMTKALHAGIKEEEIVEMAKLMKLAPPTAKTVLDIPERKRAMILADWGAVPGEISKMRAAKGGK
jgi:hypothetical protein